MAKQNTTPAIKGMFVMSHIAILKKMYGADVVLSIERAYGRPIAFKALEEVPVREEVKILELILDVIAPDTPPTKRSFEAGRLHFRNFTTTPYGRIIFSQFKNRFKLLMLNTPNIAGHVFRNVRFTSEDLGNTTVRIRMEHNDYPLEHFQGFFQEWMDFSGLQGTVSAHAAEHSVFEYTMQWA